MSIIYRPEPRGHVCRFPTRDTYWSALVFPVGTVWQCEDEPSLRVVGCGKTYIAAPATDLDRHKTSGQVFAAGINYWRPEKRRDRRRRLKQQRDE